WPEIRSALFPTTRLSGDRRSDGMDPEPNSEKLSKLVLFVIGSAAPFRNRLRSVSNVNRSGSQNASKNAAAAAEKTEDVNGVLMPRPVTMPIANDKRRRPERTEAIRILKP